MNDAQTAREGFPPLQGHPVFQLMSDASAFLRDPRLTASAVSSEPAWLWNVDATRVLWSNAAGAKLLGCDTVADLTDRSFFSNDRAAGQVARLATSLSQEGAPRLERLRGFGTGFLRPLTATCARITLPDGTHGIFILGAEAAGPSLPLPERARRLFEGTVDAIAAFTPDGALVYATAAARQRMASATTLVAFNASALALDALNTGAANGETLAGTTHMVRIGHTVDTLLVVQFGAPRAETMAMPVPAETPASAAEPAEAAPAVTEPDTVKPQAESKAPPVAVTETVTAPAADKIEPPAPVAPPPEATAPEIVSVADRQHPLRFVWQMNAEGKFTLASDEIVRIIGPHTAQVLGRTWNDISATLQLDPNGEVARALATHDTWSGITVQWPADDSDLRLKFELSGLPIYDRARQFTGYRGFGVCRDLETVEAILRQRREGGKKSSPPVAEPPAAVESEPSSTPAEVPATPAEVPARSEEAERPNLALVQPAQNVLPFRAAQPAAAENRNTGLNAGERNAFSEIARQLSARLKSTDAAPAPAHQADQNAARVLRTAPGPGIDGRAPSPPVEGEKPAAAAVPEAKSGEAPAWFAQGTDAHALLDRLPLGILVYRFDALFYANRSFLERVGYPTLSAFTEAGGLDSLFIETSGNGPNGGSQELTITTGSGEKVPVEGRLFTIPWNGESALALVLVGPKQEEAPPVVQPAMPEQPRFSEADRARIAELEQSITEARRIADAAAAERAELLGRITEQVRVPMTGTVETLDTMLEERFGPIGNERYRTYLTDIRGSGVRIVGLFEDLSSLSKIDGVKQDPAKVPGIDLNEVVQATVAKMQPEASRVRVLIRTSLSPLVAQVAAEADSLRQVVSNLLAGSIRFAGPGGQVIVSTAVGETGKAVLRLRDTGPGLNPQELAELLQPGTAATPAGAAPNADQNLTMAITRAMLEANNASFDVTSKAEDGTMIEVLFPPART